MLTVAPALETSVAALVITDHLGPSVVWSVGETRENRGVAAGDGTHKDGDGGYLIPLGLGFII